MSSIDLNKELPSSKEIPSIPSSESANAPPTEFTPRALLVLASCFLATFCSVGFVNAFGVFQEYYAQTLLADKSSSDIAWIGSFNLFCMFGCTFITGFITDKYGPRLLVCFGSVLMVFALFMMSISHQYYQLFLTQGFLFGVGISCVILPAMAAVSYHFVASRSLAMGIIFSGSSLGGVVWPIALHCLLSEVSFGWTIRIAAFIMVPLLGIACLTIRRPAEFANRPKSKADFSCVKNPAIFLLAIGLFLVFLGLFSPFFYITSWATSLGLNSNLAFYMVSVINAASLFGRILPVLIADRTGNFNVLFLVALFSGLVASCWTKATTVGGIVVFSLAYGLASGAVISLQGPCAAQTVQREQYGLAMGSVMTFLSIAGLVGTPINGQILAAFGYLGLSLFCGLAMLVGSVFILLARLKIKTGLLVKA